MRQMESESFRPYEITLRPIRAGEIPPRLRVLQKTKIGQGGFGAVYEIVVSKFFPRGSQDDYMEHMLVGKTYKTREAVENAYANAKILGEAGFPVPDTVRISEETNELIMTPEHRAGAIFISASPQSEMARRVELEFTNERIEWLATEIYKWARYAADCGINLPPDAYFLQIIPQGPLSAHGEIINIKTVDFDRVKKLPKDQFEKRKLDQQLLFTCFNRATEAIHTFIAHYNSNNRHPDDQDVKSIITRARTNPRKQ